MVWVWLLAKIDDVIRPMTLQVQWLTDIGCSSVCLALYLTSSVALVVSAMFVLNLVIVAVGSWLTLLTVWSQPTEISPESKLRSQTTNNTCKLIRH